MAVHERELASDGGASVNALARSSWRELGVVAGLILLWLAATVWLRPLALPDEGRYVGVAWEMMRSGDWLTPTLDGLPFFHKPPLFYWITGASMSLFGLNEGAARAAPLLGAWLGSFAIYLFALRWWGARGARLTLVALLAQPLLYIGGQYANLDMLVAGCISATILLLAHAVLCMEQGLAFRRTLLAAYAMAALGVLSKGLIGVVIPALVVLAWLALLRRWRVMLALFSLPGFLVFFALAGPWFVAMQMRFPDFLDYFFVVQHFKRFAASGFNNVQPFWFYPAVLLLVSLPGLPWLYRQLRAPADPQRAAIRLLMWLWVAMVVLFFSMPKSKLLGYVLPAVPPLAFLMADGFLALGSVSARQQRLWWISVGLSALLSVGTVLGFTLYPRESSRQMAQVLVAQRQAGEPLLMLNDYFYDLPLYARMGTTVPVVNDWKNPEMLKHDDGHKELIDAGQFDRSRAQTTLIGPGDLAAALCGAKVSWVVGRTGLVARFAYLSQAQAVFTRHGTTLWKLDQARPEVAGALNCGASAKP